MFTVHFRVRFPFIEPASERFAVVLCALLRSEIRGVSLTRPCVTQLVQATGTLAEPPAVLRPSGTKSITKKEIKTLEIETKPRG